MIKTRGFPKIFFGWWTILAGGFLSAWGLGYSWGLSAFFKPIASELGLSRTVTSTAASIGRFEGGFEAPLTGWVTDRFGPRGIITFGVFLIGLALILMNFINSLWGFLIVWGAVLGTGVNIGLGVPIDTSITNWFVKKRGLALSIKWVLTGLSVMLVLPLIVWLTSTQGWRMTCVIGGLIMLVVGLPLTWFCFKRYRPEYYGLLPDGATMEEEAESSQMIDKGVKYAAEVQEIEFTLKQAMRTPTFWLLIVARATQSVTIPAINVHSIPFFTDRGIDPLVGAGILAMMAFVSIPFRLVGGFLADRVSRHHLQFIIVGAYFMQALGFAVFLLNQITAMIYIWFILYGIGWGAAMVSLPAMEGRYFGRKAFGSIRGISLMITAPVGIAAPIYFGWTYDTTGSYIDAFTLVAGLLAFSAVVMTLVRPPKPPAQVSDIHKFL